MLVLIHSNPPQAQGFLSPVTLQAMKRIWRLPETALSVSLEDLQDDINLESMHALQSEVSNRISAQVRNIWKPLGSFTDMMAPNSVGKHIAFRDVLQDH